MEIAKEKVMKLNKYDQNSDLVVYAHQGVWTPWARVLCLSCDLKDITEGANKHRATTYAKHVDAIKNLGEDGRQKLVPQPEGELLGWCDSCRGRCWVRADVAMCQAVGFAMSDLDWEGDHGWRLDQTGGMCCALVVTYLPYFDENDKPTREIVFTAMDGLFAAEYDTSAEDFEWVDHLREASFSEDPYCWRYEDVTVDGMWEQAKQIATTIIGWTKNHIPSQEKR